LSSNRLIGPIGRLLDDAPPSWQSVIQPWRATKAGRQLEDFLAERLAASAVIYPARPLRALELTPRPAVRVVILGQDPYHGPGQAEGLAFSVPADVRPPPSLRNIFKELTRDGLGVPPSGHLSGWAEQGVLLLNTTLTVEDGKPASHAKQGWEALTDLLIETVASDPGPKVFLLWGGHAQAKAGLIAASGDHLVLQANHPSPLSATRGPFPFIGCGHFGAAGRFLQQKGLPAIRWNEASVL
jgi:uracil-DNA glycosylase